MLDDFYREESLGHHRGVLTAGKFSLGVALSVEIMVQKGVVKHYILISTTFEGASKQVGVVLAFNDCVNSVLHRRLVECSKSFLDYVEVGDIISLVEKMEAINTGEIL